MTYLKYFITLSIFSALLTNPILSKQFQSNNFTYKSDTFLFKNIDAQDCNIETINFRGKGKIRSEFIVINCNEFNFTGTIDCNVECRIYSRKAFDETIFKREGQGKFIIKILDTNTKFPEFNLPEKLVNNRKLVQELVNKIGQTNINSLNIKEFIENIINKIKDQTNQDDINKLYVYERLNCKIQEKIKNFEEWWKRDEPIDIGVRYTIILIILLAFDIFTPDYVISNNSNLFFLKFAGLCLAPIPIMYVGRYITGKNFNDKAYKHTLILEEINKTIDIQPV